METTASREEKRHKKKQNTITEEQPHTEKRPHLPEKALVICPAAVHTATRPS
jgi:hypothetical protein